MQSFAHCGCRPRHGPPAGRVVVPVDIAHFRLVGIEGGRDLRLEHRLKFAPGHETIEGIAYRYRRRSCVWHNRRVTVGSPEGRVIRFDGHVKVVIAGPFDLCDTPLLDLRRRSDRHDIIEDRLDREGAGDLDFLAANAIDGVFSRDDQLGARIVCPDVERVARFRHNRPIQLERLAIHIPVDAICLAPVRFTVLNRVDVARLISQSVLAHFELIYVADEFVSGQGKLCDPGGAPAALDSNALYATRVLVSPGVRVVLRPGSALVATGRLLEIDDDGAGETALLRPLLLPGSGDDVFVGDQIRRPAPGFVDPSAELGPLPY